jgi:hypothetical protein
MVIEGKFKDDDKGAVAGRPWDIDLSLDVVHVKVRDTDPVYSDYVELADRPPFKNRYAIIDFDKSNRVVGFTVEGMLEDYKDTSLRARMEIDFGIMVLRHISVSALDRILEYLRENLPTVDATGHLAALAPT